MHEVSQCLEQPACNVLQLDSQAESQRYDAASRLLMMAVIMIITNIIIITIT